MRASFALTRVTGFTLVLGLFIPISSPIVAQYQDHRALTASVLALAQRFRDEVQLSTIATSPGGRPVHALRLGAADRPAMLIIANAHGPHVVGSAAALRMAERIMAGEPAGLLDRVTVWVIPRLNPDAAEAMFAAVKWERTANDQEWDDDRDQVNGEDPFEDLNGDGLITQMRIADPNGAWIADSAEPRLLRRADQAKGEVGAWTLVGEGRDNDEDDEFNEDGPGGTDVNRNFTYNYPHHGREAGRDPFASPEARGLAEFMVEHPEIAVVYVMGPQDNLMKPWENRPSMGIANEAGVRAPEGTSAGGPLNSIMRADQPTFTDISRRFQAITGREKGAASAALAGDPLSWAYFHFGRWAFGSQVWSVPEAPRDTSAKPAARGGAAGTGGGTDALADERNALKWFAAQQAIGFAPWQAVIIPGESRVVEVGGFHPGALINPPAGAELDSALAQQHRFIGELAGMLPRLSFRDVEVTALGDGVWRVSADLVNEGVLPTTTSLATRLRNPRRIMARLDLGSATLLSGDRVQQVGPISGGGRSTKLSWTLTGRAGSTVTLSAESPVTAAVTQTITLR